MELSICIPVKNRSVVKAGEHTLYLLPNCLRALKTALQGVKAEVIICDFKSNDCNYGELLPETLGGIPVKVVRPTSFTGFFSWGRALNLAALHAKSDNIFFVDADMLVQKELISEGLRQLKEGKAYFPVFYSYSDIHHQSGVWRTRSFGNSFVSREMFREVKFPGYYKWGGEDDYFYMEISRRFQVYREKSQYLKHQWHPTEYSWKTKYCINPFYNVPYVSWHKLLKKLGLFQEKLEIFKYNC